MFWIWAENSVDNIEVFYACSAHTESRPFPLLTSPHQRVGWGCTRSWNGTRLGQLTPTGQRDIPLPIKLPSSQPTSFLTFTVPILSSIAPVGCERAAVWGLVPDGVKPQQAGMTGMWEPAAPKNDSTQPAPALRWVGDYQFLNSNLQTI